MRWPPVQNEFDVGMDGTYYTTVRAVTSHNVETGLGRARVWAGGAVSQSFEVVE